MVDDTQRSAPFPTAPQPPPPELPSAPLLAAYLGDADPTDIAALLPPGGAAAAAAHAQLAGSRGPSQTLLRIRAAGTHPAATVIEIVTDDVPFLVDSITAAIAVAGAPARVLLHPRPVVVRDGAGGLVGIRDPTLPPSNPRLGRSVRESWIRVQTRPLDSAGRAQLERTLEVVLADVRATDADTAAMRDRALALAVELDEDPPVGLDPAEVAEAAELLKWLADDYWTFIGYREYRYAAPGSTGDRDGDGDGDGVGGDDADGAAVPELTAVPGTGLGVLRSADHSPRRLPPAAARRAGEPTVLVLTKTNRRSTVLRPARLDYVGVKAFDEVGDVVGERRFLGLFPPEDRGGWVLDVPVVRRRARQVLTALGAEPDSHDGLRVLQVLGSLPRSELLAAGAGELTVLARGALRLLGRRGVRVFAREDPYGRFVSFVVLLADVEHGSSAVAAVEAALADATGGAVEPASVAVVGSGVTRLHLVVRPASDASAAVEVPDLPDLEALLMRRLADWRTDLGELLVARHPDRGEDLAARWAPAFPAAYREDVAPADAVADVFALEELIEPDAPDLSAALVPPAAAGDPWRFTLYRRGPELSLSAVLPVLSGLGVQVTDERPYRITGHDSLWVFTFRVTLPPQDGAAAPTLPWRFGEAFLAAFSGADDSDGLAALVVSAGLDRAGVAVLRTYLRWLRQTGWSFGDDYARRALLAQPEIAGGLAEFFDVRFDPDRAERAGTAEKLVGHLHALLDAVASLDQDRILRRILAAISATVRTNAFARWQSAGRPPGDLPLVLVLDPTAVPDLPHPLPWREIFVSCAAVEGVHLRFGPVARGGLRWSDRPEDFRTEVLGLAKAQTVKNTVIVPTGAKGGFVVRRPPAHTGDPVADRGAFAAAGRACYEVFIGGLLDVVDTLAPAGPDGSRAPLHPDRTVCHDGEDSYLVVAADKGTATFSDLANTIAVARGFWLGDAFASGGSAGFDHKAMGITAKGAWESVRRHFAEIGTDADTDPITVVGIGDMSGDVFGNGMLLSPHLRLVAAFDHRHVFVDPDPQPARAFVERRRLFELPRSSWADYDRAAMSSGGGVFPRDAKSITLSARACEVLGIDRVHPTDPTNGGDGGDDGGVTITPDECVQAILLAPVDLLFNGGIGTWVKAAAEPHAAAGDRVNDAVRADAAALRVAVIAEGGNLGMTQRARIEFTRAGGRCNTDFVDNSAGVDTSDREVNLKILLGQAVSAGTLDTASRDHVLAGAVQEVSAAVLGDNRSQNMASATEAVQAVSLLRAHAELARRLESDGLLERSLDSFPTESEIVVLQRAGKGLSVPEVEVLSAWTKIWLRRDLSAAIPAVAADRALTGVVQDYLPPSLRERFAPLAPTHPLAAGIAATVLVNGVVDVAGPTFASRLAEELAVDADQLVLAHTAARTVLGIDARLAELADASAVAMAVVLEVRVELRTLTERATRWLIRRGGVPVDIAAAVAAYRDGLDAVAEVLPDLLSGPAAAAYGERLAAWRAAGVPSAVARTAALAQELVAGFAITDLAGSTGREIAEVAAVHVAVARVVSLGQLAEQVVLLPRDDAWSTRARAALREDLQRAQAAVTERVLTRTAPAGTDAATRVADWLRDAESGPGAARALRLLGEAGGPATLDVGAVVTTGTAAVAVVASPELARLVVAVRAVMTLAGL